VASANIGSDTYLYAANFRNDSIDVFKDSASAPLATPGFVDPFLPVGYAPFNIENLGGNLFVTYAEQDGAKHDNVEGAGLGFVDEFDLNGNFLGRIASRGALDAPWGLAIAPSSFGKFSGDLLVGNFGDGKINAYDLITHNFVGQLIGGNGQPIAIDGLWGLAVGNNNGAGSDQTLFFTAGPNGEQNGLFGALTAVPAPSAVWLFSSALFALGFFGKRKV
jgi:uncharacterized protein (TIGR03118 family)